MAAAETHYCWMIPSGSPEEPRLLIPWSDPHEYEHRFNYLYDSVPAAEYGLDEHDAREEAVAAGWILCRRVITPLHAAKA